jgi:ATP-binding cassette subfamily F protein uup
MEYPGCLLIVSHDRYFMDRLVDHLLVFEGDGAIRDFPGNYTLYRLQEDKPKQAGENAQPTVKTAPPPEIVTVEKKKISFKEKREFELLQKEMEELSREKEKVTAQLNEGSLPYEELQKLSNRISELTNLLDEKEMRWLELSELIEG